MAVKQTDIGSELHCADLHHEKLCIQNPDQGIVSSQDTSLSPKSAGIFVHCGIPAEQQKEYDGKQRSGIGDNPEVSSVPGQRSNIQKNLLAQLSVRHSLKQAIIQRRTEAGKDVISLSEEDHRMRDAAAAAAAAELTEEELALRKRRRAQNNLAARKSRQKKKELMWMLDEEMATEKRRHKLLLNEIETLTKKKEMLAKIWKESLDTNVHTSASIALVHQLFTANIDPLAASRSTSGSNNINTTTSRLQNDSRSGDNLDQVVLEEILISDEEIIDTDDGSTGTEEVVPDSEQSVDRTSGVRSKWHDNDLKHAVVHIRSGNVYGTDSGAEVQKPANIVIGHDLLHIKADNMTIPTCRLIPNVPVDPKNNQLVTDLGVKQIKTKSGTSAEDKHAAVLLSRAEDGLTSMVVFASDDNGMEVAEDEYEEMTEDSINDTTSATHNIKKFVDKPGLRTVNGLPEVRNDIVVKSEDEDNAVMRCKEISNEAIGTEEESDDDVDMTKPLIIDLTV